MIAVSADAHNAKTSNVLVLLRAALICRVERVANKLRNGASLKNIIYLYTAPQVIQHSFTEINYRIMNQTVVCPHKPTTYIKAVLDNW